MAFKNAQQSRLLLDTLNFSPYTRGVSTDYAADMLDVTTLADTAKAFIMGQNTSTFNLDLLLDTDTTAGGEWDRLKTFQTSTADRVMSFFPAGTTAGSEAWLVESQSVALSPAAQISDAVAVTLSTQTDGRTDFGIAVTDLTTSSTGNGTTPSFPTAGTDHGAATSNGGVAHLHVTAYSGYTDLAFKIRHSTDDSTYADLSGGGFTSVTGTTAERLTIASGVTVNRYLKVQATVNGTGSVTFQFSFARR